MVSGFSSMLTFTISTLSPISLAISASSGSTFLHGAHHSAQKSTSTGLSDCSTSLVKVASVTALPAAPTGSSWMLKLDGSYSSTNDAMKRSASSAAAQPVPEAVMA